MEGEEVQVEAMAAVVRTVMEVDQVHVITMAAFRMAMETAEAAGTITDTAQVTTHGLGQANMAIRNRLQYRHIQIGLMKACTVYTLERIFLYMYRRSMPLRRVMSTVLWEMIAP